MTELKWEDLFILTISRWGKVWPKVATEQIIKIFVSITRKNIVVKKNDFLGKDISNLNNSFFKYYLRIESYNFMLKFSRRACVVYFKNMVEFLNHSKFSKGCVARSLCPIFMVDPSNDSFQCEQQFYAPLFCNSIKNLALREKRCLATPQLRESW